MCWKLVLDAGHVNSCNWFQTNFVWLDFSNMLSFVVFILFLPHVICSSFIGQSFFSSSVSYSKLLVKLF